MSSPRAVPRLVALLCLALLAATAAGEFVFDDDLEDLIAEESNVDEELAPGSVLLPSDVFNDGKPFYVERDPSTGAIDFNHKKTGNQIEMDDERRPYESIKESYVSDKKDVIVHHSTPNFHDFLNLPKMYSPENFVSISSSYANLKYQGSNKGSNHRDPAHIVSVTAVAPTTAAPAPSSSSTKFFFSRPQYGRPTTTSGGSTPGSPTYTYPITSGRPITTSTTTTPAPTTTSSTTAVTTEEEEDAPKTTTGSPPKQLFTRYPYKSTIKNKYLETSEQTRKKFFLPSTLALPGPTTTTTTTTTTERAQSTPVRSSTYYSPSVRPQWPTTTTTPLPPPPTTTLAPSSTAPAHPVRFVDDAEHPPSGSKIKFTMPALKYEGSRPAPFRRMPVPQGGGAGSSDREPGNGGSASSYNKIELPKNPAVMSLSDIFSTLEQKKRLEAEGNRVESVEQATSTTPPAIVLLDDRRTTTVYGEGPKIEQSVDLSDHYVSYEVHHQPSQGRPVAFQAQQQQQQPAYQVHQPNGHRPQQPAMDTAGGGQYVQYEVQKPQLNVVQFGTVPSMNSVVISPNQHSATFVLGSQQSVGASGGVGGAVGPGGHFVGSVSQDSPAVGTAAALIAGRPPYQMGQVLDEPHDPASSAAMVGSVQVKPQDIIKTTSVRFPSESDDKYDNAPIISGTHKSEVLPPNGHSAPVRGGEMSSVVFPAAAHELHEVSNRIVFDSAAAPSPADPLNRHEFAVAPNPHYPADLPEQLTPPSAAQDLKPRPPAPLRPPVPSQGPPSFRYSEIHRRPGATFPTDRTRPTLLPNILPQFRPNAKISHGHPPPPHLRESGTYRVGPPAGMFVKAGGPPPLRKPLPYQHQQQFGGPNRLPTTRTRLGVSPPSRPPVSAELENRRYYRLPPAPPSPPAVIKDRVYNLQPSRLQPPPPPPPPPSPPPPPQTEQPVDEPLEEHEFHRNPPQILKNLLRDELNGQQRPKLEPVVTLQMLQSKRRVEEGGSTGGVPASGVDLSTVHPQVPVDAPGTRDRPVYVVYPVKSTPVKLDRPGADAIVVRGEHPPPPPAMVISPGTEYQNTPFSIASHFEQEPILVAKHKKVAHQNANSVKLNFPYSLEKPDPHALTHATAVHPAPAQDLAAEYSEYNLGEEPSGGLGAGAQEQDQDLISSKLQRFHSTTDSTPIAIAYTPTESSLGPAGVPNSMRYNKPPMGTGGAHNHNNNYYYSVYGETQTEVSHLKLDDVDEFGNPSRRYEQSFQAPFQASMSLDPVKVTNPYEGWAVVTSSPQALALQHSKPSQPPPPPKPEPVPDRNTIDRSDTSATGAEDDPAAVTPGERPASVVTPAASSGPFDPNSFQPELQGGFRPILGADVKLSEQLNPDPQRSSIADLFVDDPPAVPEQPEPAPKPQATKLQLVPKDTKPKVVKKEEPDGMEELDLEAFFDRLSKDYDDGELDDVTMSDETTNGTDPGSGEQQRAVGEGRSSQGASGIAADEAAVPGTEGTSRTPDTTTTTEKPTTATEAT
ncbi:proline-rich protein 36 [Anopheles bellator]|uniref:proline-rich protein 36 n=1 Tax=Anopheles bellator TaxID=139047 RepID=UPI002646FD1A|nr:proline-rich protein 36 [Anopheles bellator]